MMIYHYVIEILTIETNPKFKSINLSHSVIIVCYEWLRKLRLKIKKRTY